MLLTESKNLEPKQQKGKRLIVIQVDQHSSTLLFSDKKKGNIPDFFDNILSLVIVAKKEKI